ncbi:ABA4-like family protein [Leptolyngbya sp. AN02str]|uniref:ABA4-like family protein n=1 Tax=Leptolyngbya sp. AN02str TaxID=3423363 RepID=UPI003D31A3F9
MPLELIFNIANIFVLPFWALMILLPKWKVTRTVMGSMLPFVALAGAYIYGFASSLDPDTAEAFTNTDLATIASLFSNPSIAATGWIHFLVMDLFVGRWIYLEGQRTGVWTVHSLALCLFAGPMGLLSHIITTWVSQRFFPQQTDEQNTEVSATPAQPTDA